MLFLAFAGGQAGECAAARIQGIEMPSGVDLPIDDRIMTGGLVPVTGTGINVEIVQLGGHRQPKSYAPGSSG